MGKTMIDFGNDERAVEEDNNQPEYKIFGRIEKINLTLYKKNHQPHYFPDGYNDGDGFLKFLEDENCLDFKDELESRAYFLHVVVKDDVKQTELSRKILEGQRTVEVQGEDIHFNFIEDDEDEEIWSEDDFVEENFGEHEGRNDEEKENQEHKVSDDEMEEDNKSQ